MSAPAVPFAYIQNFCQNLNPEVARHAPERGKSLALRVLRQSLASHSDVCCRPLRPVTMLAKGIAQHSEAAGPVRSFLLLFPFLPHCLHYCVGHLLGF